MNAPCLFLQRLGVESLDVKLGPKPTMLSIAREVAARHNLSLIDLQGLARTKRVVWPRQEAMALIRAQGRYSYPQIGRFFGRDHTTVMHAVVRHAERSARAVSNG